MPSRFDKARRLLKGAPPLDYQGEAPLDYEGEDLEKKTAKRWDESLYVRDAKGRFRRKPGLGVASHVAEALPKPQNTANAKELNEAFQRGYNKPNPYQQVEYYDRMIADRTSPKDVPEELRTLEATNYWDLSYEERQRMRDLQAEHPLHQRPGYLEAGRAGAKQRIHELEQNVSVPRREVGLPGIQKPGNREAGKAAAKKVKQARRRWLEKRAYEALNLMGPDHPQREYWEGVREGAREQSRLDKPVFGYNGDEEAGYLRGLEIERDRREVQLERAKNALARIPEGHRERPYWEGRVRGIEEALLKPDNRATYKAGEAYAAAAHDVDALKEQVDRELSAIDHREAQAAELENDERMRMFWNAAKDAIPIARRNQQERDAMHQKGVAEGAALRGDARRERIAAARRRIDRGVAVQLNQGILEGAGAPMKEVPVDAPGFKLGRDLGGQDLIIDKPVFDLELARLNLRQAEADQNDAGIAYWAGIIEGLKGPKPIVGLPSPDDVPDSNLSDASARRAVLEHRLPGEEYLDAPVAEVRDLGGGVNTTLKGRLDNGQEVIIKPAAGAAGNMRAGIPAGTDLERERASYLVAQKLGIYGATPIIGRHVDLPDGYDYHNGDAIVQGFIPDAVQVGFSWNSSPEDTRRIALLDAVIGNTDRHGGNALAVGWENGVAGPDGIRIVPIDHGLTFSSQENVYGNTQALDLAKGAPITDEERQALLELGSDEWARDLMAIGIPRDAIVLMRRRIRKILEQDAIPHPRELGLL